MSQKAAAVPMYTSISEAPVKSDSQGRVFSTFLPYGFHGKTPEKPAVIHQPPRKKAKPK